MRYNVPTLKEVNKSKTSNQKETVSEIKHILAAMAIHYINNKDK